MSTKQDEYTLYECGICDCLHHWEFEGDCREDDERYGDTQDYRERNNLTVNDWDIEVRSWEERTEADGL